MQLPRATRLVIRIAGERMYLWRAVDHEGEVLDMLVQRRRDTRAALRLMRKLLKTQGFAPKLVITDKLRSYRGVPVSAPDLPTRTRAQAQQSRGEFASSRATTRAQNAAVQISSLRSALPQHACHRTQHLQPSTPSRLTLDAPDLPSRGGGSMAGCGCRGVIVYSARRFSLNRS